MNAFLRKGFSEYMRRAELKKRFTRENKRIYKLFESADFTETSVYPLQISRREEFLALLLSPLVNVAWADGKVTSGESEAILQAADGYGLSGFEEIYFALMETLISRPSPKMTARNWHNLYGFLSEIPEREFELICDSILLQAQFVAEQSSNNLIGFLRGDGICGDEETALRQIGEEFEKIKLVRLEQVNTESGVSNGYKEKSFSPQSQDRNKKPIVKRKRQNIIGAAWQKNF